jgi:hypothetical protein
MTTQSMKEMTSFKRTPKGVRLVDDRGSLVVEWRNGCPNQPTNHDDAAAEAIVVMRERGVIS